MTHESSIFICISLQLKFLKPDILGYRYIARWYICLSRRTTVKTWQSARKTIPSRRYLGPPKRTNWVFTLADVTRSLSLEWGPRSETSLWRKPGVSSGKTRASSKTRNRPLIIPTSSNETYYSLSVKGGIFSDAETLHCNKAGRGCSALSFLTESGDADRWPKVGNESIDENAPKAICHTRQIR